MTTKYYRFLTKNGGYVWMQSYATIVHNSRSSRPHCIVSINYVLSKKEYSNIVFDTEQINTTSAYQSTSADNEQYQQSHRTKKLKLDESKVLPPVHHHNHTHPHSLDHHHHHHHQPQPQPQQSIAHLNHEYNSQVPTQTNIITSIPDTPLDDDYYDSSSSSHSNGVYQPATFLNHTQSFTLNESNLCYQDSFYTNDHHFNPESSTFHHQNCNDKVSTYFYITPLIRNTFCNQFYRFYNNFDKFSKSDNPKMFNHLIV